MITRIFWLVFIVIYLAGCTTMVPAVSPVRQQGDSGVQTGDRVAIFLRSGQTREFSVQQVTPEQICGKHECVRVEEIVSVNRQEVSALKTLGLVCGIALIVAFGLALQHPGFLVP